jgi:Ca2+/Na+ antiporter
MKNFMNLTFFIGSILLICISTFFKNKPNIKAFLYFILLIVLLLISKFNAFAVLISTLLIWLGDGLVQEFTKNQKLFKDGMSLIRASAHVRVMF